MLTTAATPLFIAPATITPFPTGGNVSDESPNRQQAARTKLDAGEWLRAGDLGALLGSNRFRASEWLNNGVVINGERFFMRYRRTPGGRREANPDDVRVVLAAYERQRRGRENTEETDR